MRQRKLEIVQKNRAILGGTPQICGVLGTPRVKVDIAFFRKNFRSVELDVQEIFSKNFSKFPNKISDFFSKSKKKTVILVFKLVRNHYDDQNLAKFSLKTPIMM